MDALTQIPLTLALAKAGLAAGTTTTLTIGTTTPFAIKGKAYSKASVSNTATPTTDATTGAAFLPVPAGYGCVFVIGVDKDGAVKVSQGQIQQMDGVADGANAKFIIAPQFPIVPDTVCPLGYLITKVGTSGAAWTFGSSNLAGPPSNVLHTFQDCITLPDRPQV
jgi:hypothetical protein